MNYDGDVNNINKAMDDPRQNKAESCQSYCKTNYPAATHFSWVSPSSSWTNGHNRCWCRYSTAGRGVKSGTTSGEVIC